MATLILSPASAPSLGAFAARSRSPSARRRSAGRSPLVCRAGNSTEGSSMVTEKITPEWAGETFLSSAVNAVIQCPPLFAVMKVLAKDALKKTAAKSGVLWDETVRKYEAIDEVKSIKDEMEDKSIEYPGYYLQEFHAYSEGNLNWLAAFEVAPATDSMALRVYKNEDISPMEAQERLRKGIFDSIKGFQVRNACRSFTDLLDEGCSVGISTRWMAKEWPEAKIIGLDLSPHFLAVAELEERQHGGQRTVSKYMHANAETTGMEDSSFDLITLTFTLHECPQLATINIMKEARRILRPGGVLAITDNDPKSPVIQGLPPVLFTLMKSTEPWSDDYYTLDFEQALLNAGFDAVESIRCDPRHRTVVARAGPCA